LLRHVWQFLKDPRASLIKKIIAFLPFLYVLLPIDLRPDWFPVIGWFDDAIAIVIGIFLLWWFTRKYRRIPSKTGQTSAEDKTVEGEYRIIK